MNPSVVHHYITANNDIFFFYKKWTKNQKASSFLNTVNLDNKEWFDKEQISIGIKKPFPVTNLPFTS